MSSKVRFNGYNLPRPVRDMCIAELKMYPYLTGVKKSMEDINGYEKSFVDKIITRVDIEKMIQVIEDVFLKVPEKYLDSIKYLLFSRDSKEQKKTKIEYEFENDYGETVVWMDKLIYLFAKELGLPVSESGKEFNLIINDDGSIELN